jgi:L-ribulokinase
VSARYVIGLDCGTLSARGVLIDVATGAVVKSAVAAYAHGVMDERLPGGPALRLASIGGAQLVGA